MTQERFESLRQRDETETDERFYIDKNIDVARRGGVPACERSKKCKPMQRKLLLQQRLGPAQPLEDYFARQLRHWYILVARFRHFRAALIHVPSNSTR